MVEYRCEECEKDFSSKESFDMHNSSKHYQTPKVKVNKKKIKNWGIFIGLVLILVLIAYGFVLNEQRPGKYDDFATCLTENDVKMFGAYWCPHCQDQKNLFGRSFKNVNYIECSLPNQGGQNELCNDEGIQSYPTWEFSDGERQVGVVSLEQLSAITGCSLN